jgi:hypothetical protein
VNYRKYLVRIMIYFGGLFIHMLWGLNLRCFGEELGKKFLYALIFIAFIFMDVNLINSFLLVLTTLLDL